MESQGRAFVQQSVQMSALSRNLASDCLTDLLLIKLDPFVIDASTALPACRHVPEFLIAFVLRILAPFMYSTVVSMLQRIFSPESTSKLAERLEQRVDLYPIVKRRVKRFLEDKALAGGGAPA
jgi:hypothetical protein